MITCTVLTRSIGYMNVSNNQGEKNMTTVTVSNNRAVRIVHNPIVRNAGTTIATVERYAMKLNATFAIADVGTMSFEEW